MGTVLYLMPESSKLWVAWLLSLSRLYRENTILKCNLHFFSVICFHFHVGSSWNITDAVVEKRSISGGISLFAVCIAGIKILLNVRVNLYQMSIFQQRYCLKDITWQTEYTYNSEGKKSWDLEMLWHLSYCFSYWQCHGEPVTNICFEDWDRWRLQKWANNMVPPPKVITQILTNCHI